MLFTRDVLCKCTWLTQHSSFITIDVLCNLFTNGRWNQYTCSLYVVKVTYAPTVCDKCLWTAGMRTLPPTKTRDLISSYIFCIMSIWLSHKQIILTYHFHTSCFQCSLDGTLNTIKQIGTQVLKFCTSDLDLEVNIFKQAFNLQHFSYESYTLLLPRSNIPYRCTGLLISTQNLLDTGSFLEQTSHGSIG